MVPVSYIYKFNHWWNGKHSCTTKLTQTWTDHKLMNVIDYIKRFGMCHLIWWNSNGIGRKWQSELHSRVTRTNINQEMCTSIIGREASTNNNNMAMGQMNTKSMARITNTHSNDAYLDAFVYKQTDTHTQTNISTSRWHCVHALHLYGSSNYTKRGHNIGVWFFFFHIKNNNVHHVNFPMSVVMSRSVQCICFN